MENFRNLGLRHADRRINSEVPPQTLGIVVQLVHQKRVGIDQRIGPGYQRPWSTLTPLDEPTGFAFADPRMNDLRSVNNRLVQMLETQLSRPA